MAKDFLSYVVLCVPSQLIRFRRRLLCTTYGGKCSFMWTGSRFR